MKTKINTLLIFLILLDLALSTVGLAAPELWVRLMHGVPYHDNLGMVRRLGAVWAAFFLFQLIALFRWPKAPYWLVLVAGIRWTEVFSDWVTLGFADSTTMLGKFGLLIAPPVNILAGWFFLRCFLKINKK